jgi:antistasin family protein
MMQHRLGKCRSDGSLVLLVGAVLIAGVHGGCTGEIASGGPGSSDGGGGVDSGGVGVDSGGHTCPGLGCFPNCPNGVLKDKSGCDTCQCAPAADAGGDAGGTGLCATDADCPSGRICGFLESAACAATGQCFSAATGPRCGIASTVGCGCNGTDVSIDPSCYSGLPAGYVKKPVLHVGTCTTDAGGPTTDSGGACISQQGGPCGGNTAHPCTCAAGLTCTPGDSGLPFGDVGGTCQ